MRKDAFMPSRQRSDQVAEQLSTESERGVVIIGSALIEDDLRSLFRAAARPSSSREKEAFERLLSSAGPLGSLWAKATTARLFGLITENSFVAVDIIRKLRNQFAHSQKPLHLTDPEIHAQVRALDRLLNGDRSNGDDGTAAPSRKRSAMEKKRFILCVAHVCGAINVAAYFCEQMQPNLAGVAFGWHMKNVESQVTQLIESGKNGAPARRRRASSGEGPRRPRSTD